MVSAEEKRKYNYRIAPRELPYATPPFSYEFIEKRVQGKWRIRDSKDNAVGWAENEEAAKYICDHLNKEGA